MWKEKWKWNTNLNSQKLQKWMLNVEQLRSIPHHTIARYLGLLNDDQCCVESTLHCFCDASAKAYAALVYLHQSSSRMQKVNLIFSKTCLAPEYITIPRLELLGVLIRVRALRFVEEQLALPVTSKILWTDSQCVLHWIRTTKPLPVFVTNRLNEIKSSQGICFRCIQSEDNPADIATRGKPATELSSFWWTGPQWLQR